MEAIAQNRKEQESKHFTSLQIFTSHAEPSLDEYLPRKDQQLLEQKHRDEEDKLYRKFLEQRREDEDKITKMEEEEREVYLNQAWTALSSGPASPWKNCKTPFFSRYSKFLSMGNWYRSRTSPKFFLKKNSNKCAVARAV